MDHGLPYGLPIIRTDEVHRQDGIELKTIYFEDNHYSIEVVFWVNGENPSKTGYDW